MTDVAHVGEEQASGGVRGGGRGLQRSAGNRPHCAHAEFCFGGDHLFTFQQEHWTDAESPLKPPLGLDTDTAKWTMNGPY
eukprot:7353678-Pyramimonas_sp.AAC.2